MADKTTKETPPNVSEEQKELNETTGNKLGSTQIINRDENPSKHWKDEYNLYLLGVCLVLIGTIIAGIKYNLNAVIIWGIIGILIFISIVIAGKGVVGRWQGLLIDDRNRFALSRLQLILWTTLILSAFVASVTINLNYACKSNPINATVIANAATIAVPQDIWILMGIATTSLVGSPLILSMNKGKTVAGTAENRADVIKAHEALKNEGRAKEDLKEFAAAQVDGQLIVNSDPKWANWSDMFKGDYTNNAAQLDLGKVQMLYFTLIVLIVYTTALVVLLASSKEEIHQFPALSEGMIALLGISNGGYLLNKTVSATKPK
jgi:hypothetical protein